MYRHGSLQESLFVCMFWESCNGIFQKKKITALKWLMLQLKTDVTILLNTRIKVTEVATYTHLNSASTVYFPITNSPPSYHQGDYPPNREKVWSKS